MTTTTRSRKKAPAAGDSLPASTGLDLGPLPGLLGYALRRAQVAVFADFMASFATLDLRPAQFSVLLLMGLALGVFGSGGGELQLACCWSRGCLLLRRGLPAA